MMNILTLNNAAQFFGGEKRTFRIYWDYIHTSLRYEDLTNLLRSGFEVIPRRPHVSDPRVESDYEDALSEQYIPWQSCCTLPTNLVEQLRRLRLVDAASFKPEQWELLNAHIDCLFVQLPPKALACVAANFRGTILQRIFGYHGKTYSQFCRDEGIDPGSFPPHVYYSPNLPMLADYEESPFKDRHLAIPTTCSPARLPYRWLGQQSEPFASTVIAHLRAAAMKEIFNTFRPLCNTVQLCVLGMNDPDHSNPRMDVVGSLPWDDYLSMLCRSRVHIETGINPLHLRFSPLEASLCGIPVLFRTDGGLARFLKYRGVPFNKQRLMGAMPNVECMARFLKHSMENVNRLTTLAENLRDALLKLDLAEEFRTGCAKLAAKHNFVCRPTVIPHWPAERKNAIPSLPGATQQWQVNEIFEFDEDLAEADVQQNAWVTRLPQEKRTAIAKGVINQPFHGQLRLHLVDSQGQLIPQDVCWVAISARDGTAPHFIRRRDLQKDIDAPRGLLMRLMWNGKDAARISQLVVTRSA